MQEELTALNLLVIKQEAMVAKYFCMDHETGRKYTLYFLSRFENARYCVKRKIPWAKNPLDAQLPFEYTNTRRRVPIKPQGSSYQMPSVEDKTFEELLDCSAVATFGIDPDHHVIFWNKACEELTGIQASDMIGTKNHWRAFYDQERPCLADIAISGKYEELWKLYKVYGRSLLVKDGLHAEGWFPMVGLKKRYLTFDAVPVYNDEGHLISAIETLQDRTAQKLIEEERGMQVLEIQKVLSTQKTLKGYIPICTSCKKVRNSKGSWEQIEPYISERSEAKFTNILCPECSKKVYPEFYKD